MMELAKTAGLFALSALAGIVGCYLPWPVIRQGCFRRNKRWLRNIAVALGNAPASPDIRAALNARREHPSELVREHVAWALQRPQTAR